MFNRFEMIRVLLLFTITIHCIGAADDPNRGVSCQAVEAEYGILCFCNGEKCDSMEVPAPYGDKEYVIVTSTKSGERFVSNTGEFSEKSQSSGSNTLKIDQDNTSEQSKIIGFGAYWSGSVRDVVGKMESEELRTQLYDAYFSREKGIGYNMLRLPIGGALFDPDRWAEDETENNEPDPELKQFEDLDPRDKKTQEQIKEMVQITGNKDIQYTGIIWTPPRWMKQKQDWNGKPDNQLIKEYYQAEADLIARYANLTNNNGIPIWGMSTGNQPSYSVLYPEGVEGMSWEACNQADWIVENLIPALDKTGIDIKLTIYDDMRPTAIDYLKNMSSHRPESIEKADIIGIQTFLDFESSPEILDTVKSKYGMPILNTQSAFGYLDKPQIANGSWERGEDLTELLMTNLRHDVSGFFDWNFILNDDGGPSFAGATFNSYINANSDYTAFYKQPLFYHMGHFSKFIPRDSLRIDSKISGPNDILSLSYLRPDNQVAIILYNNETSAVDVTLDDSNKGVIDLTLKPKSINTITYTT